MRWEVVQNPAYTLLKVYLEHGEDVTSEPGAMVLMRGPIGIKTHTGGIGSGLKRALLGGEALFLNTYIAEGPSQVWFAPPLPGDITYVPLTNNALIIQDTSYLAHHGNVKLTTAWRGLRGVLTEGSLVWLKAEGQGGVWLNSYGGIERVDILPGEKIIVDNFHFVAMSDGMKWHIRKFGGIKSFILGGEGIVAEVEGPGTIYVQTRSLPPFADMLRKFIKK
jgi:uncharacterized protein (TIGR00266 family)